MMSKKAMEEIERAEQRAKEIIADTAAHIKKSKIAAEDKINNMSREFAEELKVLYTEELNKIKAAFQMELEAERLKAENTKKQELEKYKALEKQAVDAIVEIIMN